MIALTGRLGAGKTTVLNHLLCRPGARVGVIVNDFGDVNVDAALVASRVDEAESITGGCVCCLPDAGGLDDALARLTSPRLRLDAVIVEASGAADPLSVARLIRFSGAEHARPGGVVEVVDATTYRGAAQPTPSPVALVVISKTDLLPAPQRAQVVAEIGNAARRANPAVTVVLSDRGRVDPALVYDVASEHDPLDELPLAALARAAHDHGQHAHARAVTVTCPDPVDAGTLIDLLEQPPPGVYRMKGCVPVRTARGHRRYLVNLVGRAIHIATAPADFPAGSLALVAIGAELDERAVRSRLRTAVSASGGTDAASGMRRLQRHRRLSR